MSRLLVRPLALVATAHPTTTRVQRLLTLVVVEVHHPRLVPLLAVLAVVVLVTQHQTRQVELRTQAAVEGLPLGRQSIAALAAPVSSSSVLHAP